MEGQKQIRVIIADDHIILRQGLRMLLEQDKELEIIGEANNGREVLSKLAESGADVVLMDINMPEMDGFETTEAVGRQFPEVKVIALSMHNNLPFVQKMLASGASGYLLKTTSKEELCAAIKLVAGGGRYISGDISVKLVEQASQPVPQAASQLLDDKKLSKREVQVLTLIAEGYTNAEIAEKLFTSKRTIETHRQNILEKTQAKNTANLIKYAFEHKIIGVDNQL